MIIGGSHKNLLFLKIRINPSNIELIIIIDINLNPILDFQKVDIELLIPLVPSRLLRPPTAIHTLLPILFLNISACFQVLLTSS